MKILVPMPRPLFPTDTGGKIRTWNIFSHLSERVELHAISLAQRGRDDEGVEQMKKAFASYTPVYWNEARRFSASFYLEFVRMRFSRFPYFLGKYHIAELERVAQALHEQHQFDLVLCDFLHAATPFVGSTLRPRVLFQHNLEYRIRRQHWQNEKNPAKKLLLKAEWQKAFEIEREVCRDFDQVITVSAEDTRDHRAEFNIRHVADIPTGVDTEYFAPLSRPRVAGQLVFVGSFDWYPNEDGVNWFVMEVLPRIRSACPSVTLKIVGRNPSAQVRKAVEHEGVEVTGTVPDVRPYIAESDVVIVPLRMGGGTRIKIFEAMSMQRAVVSTPIGAEGLPVENGREIVLESSAEGFANAVIRLLADERERRAIGHAAREKVVRDHTWSAVAARMEQLLRVAAGFKHSSAAQPEGRLVTNLAE